MTCSASTERNRLRSKGRSNALGAGLRFLDGGDAHQSCIDVTLRLDQPGALPGGWIPMVAADDRHRGARRAGRTWWTTRRRGKALRRRAPSPSAFMGDPSRTRDFPFQPSSVHFVERMTRRRGKTLRRRAPSPGTFMGDPSRTRLFSSSLLQSIFLNGRHAGVGRLCDGGHRRQARSWGGHREPTVFSSSLLQSIFSNSRNAGVGRLCVGSWPLPVAA